MGPARFCIVALLLAAGLQADTPADWVNRAEELIRQGDRAGALDALNKAESATPASAESEDRIGFLLAVLQNPDSVEHFRKSLALDSNYAPAHYHLGVALWLGSKREDALPELERATELAPFVFEYRYRLGTAYMELNNVERAVPELKQAVAIDASQPKAWNFLGRALQQSGDLASAADAYAHAVTLDGANDTYRNDYAYMLIETRQADRGIEESNKVLAHNPSDTTALMNIGYANLKKGEFPAAEKAYRQAIAADSKSAAAHYDLGIALKQQDQLEAAQAEFKEAIRLDPSLPQAHYTLGITDWQMGDFAGMTQELRAALALSPDYAEAHYMLGIALKQSGDLDAAMAELKEAIRLDPTTPGPYNTLGQILRLKGDKQASEEAFATGSRLKREKDAELANSLEQGMRGGTFLKPITNPAR